MGYLCANFSLPRPLCSRLRPDVRDRRQTDIRQHHCLMPLPRGRGHNNDNNQGDKNNNECTSIASSVLKCPAVARDTVDNPVFILTLVSIRLGLIQPCIM